MKASRHGRTICFLLALLMTSSGCVALGAAGAGAGTALYLTSRGASGAAPGMAGDVAQRTEDVFEEMDIEVTADRMERAGDERALEGRIGDTDITVEIEQRTDDTVWIDVSARTGALTWDQDLARQILEKIVAEG
jgi:hypothetical protein